ncbi:MAG: hypothetical protein QW041_01665 [Candidatus Pacearchaeota archaeon]
MKNNDEIEESKDIFIKLEPSDSIELKRTLLEISASSIKMQLISKRFKEKTNQEIKERALAKRYMRETSNLIYQLIEKLPKIKDIPYIVKKHVIEEKQPIKETKLTKEDTLMLELENIKKKILSLQ